MVRGLDERQKGIREQSKSRIFDYISQNEPCSQAMIVKKSGVKDPKVIRKRLENLLKNGKISTIRLFHIVNSNKGRWHYYSTPPTFKIKNDIVLENYLQKIDNKYYSNTIDDVPIYIQFQYKLNCLLQEYLKLKEKFEIKAKGFDFESITHFEEYQLQAFADLKEIRNIVISNPDSYSMYQNWYDDVMKQAISKMDLMFYGYKTLLGNTVAGGPIKTLIADLMIKNTKSAAMRKMGFSSKLGAKFDKELLNEDGSPKIDVINEINIKSIGVKEFGPIPSGETLMKKWKDLQ